MGTCIWDKAWIGICKKPTDESGLCEEHRGKKCAGCGEPAIKDCAHTGIQFCCGAPLCANCTHGMPDPKNPGMFMLGGGHHPRATVKKQYEERERQKEQEKAEERPKPVCELCHRSKPKDDLGWDIIFQSYVCPDCQLKAKRDKLVLSDVRGGHYAEGRPDPRS